MSADLIISLGTLAGAVVLFATEKLPVDIVALLVTAVLLITGVVTLEEGIAGFSSPAVITVACMFVLSAGLQKTGALGTIGSILSSGARGKSLLCLLIIAMVVPISAFINNTAAVAVLLPLVIGAANVGKIPASKLLIPLSFASQFGGVCTLIGTSTNLLVNSIAERSGVEGFNMFEFAPLGISLTIIGTIFLVSIGQWLLPDRPIAPLTETYQLRDYITELRVMEHSPLVGKRIDQSPLLGKHGVTIVEVRRGEQTIVGTAAFCIQPHDLLLVRSAPDQLMTATSALGLEIEPEFKLGDEAMRTNDVQLCEALVPPGSRGVGRSLIDLRLSEHLGVVALAIQRTGHVLRNKLASIPLRVGDALLLIGKPLDIERVRADETLLVLNQTEPPTLLRGKAPLALGVLALAVTLAALEILPIMVGALCAVLVLIITRCLRADQAYAAVDWRVLVMLAGILPLGVAMQKTGAAQAIANFVLNFAGHENPVAILSAIYLITALLTECMSNNGAAVLIAPIAIATAQALHLDPKPFLIAVTIAASTSFATPVGYQTNTMVYNAGGYKFTDFLRIGIPLNIIFWAVSTWLIPKWWPLVP